MLVYHIVTELCEPVNILACGIMFSVNKSAPLTDKKRIHILFNEVCPCTVPVIVKKCLTCEGLAWIVKVEPFLLPYSRTVVVRRVNYLLVVLTDIYGMILYAAEISSPPCAPYLAGLVVVRIVYRRSAPVSALLKLWIALNALYHDEQVRVVVETSHSALLGSILPVVLVL